MYYCCLNDWTYCSIVGELPRLRNIFSVSEKRRIWGKSGRCHTCKIIMTNDKYIIP